MRCYYYLAECTVLCRNKTVGRVAVSDSARGYWGLTILLILLLGSFVLHGFAVRSYPSIQLATMQGAVKADIGLIADLVLWPDQENEA